MGNPSANMNTGHLGHYQTDRFPSSKTQPLEKFRGFRPLLHTIQEEKESKECAESDEKEDYEEDYKEKEEMEVDEIDSPDVCDPSAFVSLSERQGQTSGSMSIKRTDADVEMEKDEVSYSLEEDHNQSKHIPSNSNQSFQRDVQD
ncbi:hypothetical protein PDJAM_G00112190 [Pangasius djambal]|uniref:Uncharacterized protein n=1 Tax=Pangasius djambal TaxID=1691987 RepID=A0ACC5Y2T2_9TELE|nr:hypothetical protein [Pangasius djambal]